MDDRTLEVLARTAGLDLALKDYRSDLEAAARQIEEQRRTLGTDKLPSDAEPWPPMIVGDAP